MKIDPLLLALKKVSGLTMIVLLCILNISLLRIIFMNLIYSYSMKNQEVQKSINELFQNH